MFKPQPVQDQRARVLSTARKMLGGSLGIIEGARILAALRHRLASEDNAPDFLTFVAIDSETDHLPVGAERQHWSDAVLAKKEKEIREVEAFFREEALAACRRLIERFGSAA